MGFVGIMDVEIHLPECRSLKAKRSHLQRTKARLERMLGASVAEVEYHDLWQRSRLALAFVRRDAGDVTEAFEQARRYLSQQEFVLVRADARLLSVEEAIR